MPKFESKIIFKKIFTIHTLMFVLSVFCMPHKRLLADESAGVSLSYLVVSINSERRQVERDAVLEVVRGDLIILLEGWCSVDGTKATQKVESIDLLGFAPKRARYGLKNDMEFVIDTGSDLQSKFSKNSKGIDYEIDAYINKEIVGSINLRLIEPKLVRVDLSINGKSLSLVNDELLSLKKTDSIAVTKVVTNVRGNENVRHELKSKDRPGSKTAGKALVFYRGDIVVGQIPINYSEQ